MKITRKSTVVFILISIVTLILYSYLNYDPFGKCSFDKEIWLSSVGGKGDRSCMVKNLMKKILHTGLSIDSIHSLLGKPDFTNETEERYQVGCFINGWDDAYLIIQYSKDNRAAVIKLDGW